MKEVEITIEETQKILAYINGEHPNVYTKDGNI